jgi:hypothetical protein
MSLPAEIKASDGALSPRWGDSINPTNLILAKGHSGKTWGS